MKFVIGASHFERFKQQSHELRSHLIKQSDFDNLKSIYSKSAFLNIWATVLGYADWGDFQAQTKYAHKSNKNTLVVTPNTIAYLGSKLCELSYFNKIESGTFEDAIFLTASPEEKSLFHDGDIKFYSKSLGSSEFPIHLEMGPNPYINVLMDYILNLPAVAEETVKIDKQFCEYAKEQRTKLKLIKKQDIAQSNLDIYPNSGQRSADLIKSALEQDWIEIFTSYSWHEPKTFFRLSQRAIRWIYSSHTEDYGDNWLLWNKSIDNTLQKSKREKLIEKDLQRIKAFINGVSADEYSDSIVSTDEDRLRIISSQIKLDIPDYDGSSHVFHITPRLLLDYGDVKSFKGCDYSVKVAVKFYGNQNEVISRLQIGEDNFILSRPMPSKRHVFGQSPHGHHGIYVKVPGGVSKIELIYTWTNAKTLEECEHSITHDVLYIKGNKLLSAYHPHNFSNELHKGKDKPFSFTKLNSVAGSASTVEEVKTKNRFSSQIIRYQRNDDRVMIEETFPLITSSMQYYW